MDAGLMDSHDRGSAVAGRVLGIIATVLLVVSIVLIVVFMIGGVLTA
jgi:uncharacterized membrane protein